MKKGMILALFVLAVVAQSTNYSGLPRSDLVFSRDLDFEFVGDGKVALKPQIFGGSGHFDYSYDRLPAEWNGYDEELDGANPRFDLRNSLFIPLQSQPVREQITVSIYDIEEEIEVTKMMTVEQNEK